MFSVVAKLLFHKQILFEKGKIYLLGQPIIILPVEEFSIIQEFLEKNDLENLIYFSAKKSGMKWLEHMIPNYHMKEKDVIEWGCNILTLSGWGDLTLLKKDLSKPELVFELKNATMGSNKSNKTYSTDHLIRGYVAAFANFVYKMDMDAVEVKCLSKGDPSCKYVVRPKKDFDQSNQIVIKQLKKIDL